LSPAPGFDNQVLRPPRAGFFIPEVRMGIDSGWQRFIVQVDRERAAPQAEESEFDRWMRHRVNVAHTRYMERTSYHLSCDWPPFSPEAIADFIERCR
jgi:hypothetical protein